MSPQVSEADHRESDVVADNPDAYIAGDRRRALASGVSIPDRVRGSGLFVDISGFTPLTEALATELGPRRGAEELTAVLDRIFDAVLGELHRYGGSVVYFSGDAVTCWLDGDDGALAVACGLDMQRAMATVPEVRTPGGQTFQIGMKVAVAAGKARRFVVGDPDVQLIDVLAGVANGPSGGGRAPRRARRRRGRGIDLRRDRGPYRAHRGPRRAWRPGRCRGGPSRARSGHCRHPPLTRPSLARSCASGCCRRYTSACGRVTAISSPSCDRQ